jgi:hypothetical protein
MKGSAGACSLQRVVLLAISSRRYLVSLNLGQSSENLVCASHVRVLVTTRAQCGTLVHTNDFLCTFYFHYLE